MTGRQARPPSEWELQRDRAPPREPQLEHHERIAGRPSALVSGGLVEHAVRSRYSAYPVMFADPVRHATPEGESDDPAPTEGLRVAIRQVRREGAGGDRAGGHDAVGNDHVGGGRHVRGRGTVAGDRLDDSRPWLCMSVKKESPPGRAGSTGVTPFC